jgi:heavy metal sensor kinase
MRVWHRLRRVRTRLTLSYVAAMVVVLGVYAGGVYGFVSRNVSRSLDTQVRADYMWAAEMWEERADGSLGWFDGADNDEDHPWLQVWGASKALLFQTAVAQRIPLAESADFAARASGAIERVDGGGMPYRVLSRPAVIGDKPVVIQVARSEAPMRRELRDLMLFMVLGLPFGVAAAALGGYALARGALAPVGRMVERARSITAERLHDRLPVDNPDDELGRLATVFNRTLERLEQSFQQMGRFTADVSHELRTPLTAIRTVGEVALRQGRHADAYRTTIGSMLEEVERLTGLVERLLALSRADAGLARLRIERFDLGVLADDVAGRLQVLAEEKRQSIVVRRPGPAPCDGDQTMVRHAVINLVDNAMKYSPEDSEIAIHVDTSATGVGLEVIDSGPGIDPERGAHIFDRFYRGSSGVDQRSHGLGLSIARAAIVANRGTLTWEPRRAKGTVFRLTLPIDAARQSGRGQAKVPRNGALALVTPHEPVKEISS